MGINQTNLLYTSLQTMAKCSYQNCVIDSIDDGIERVDVRTTLPKVNLKNLKRKLQVSWSLNGDATFHNECWKTLLAVAYNGKKRKGIKKTFDLSPAEKRLVRDAAKTAEFHDSDEKLKIVAKQTAEMIKKSKYCVAFTGAGISTSAGIGDYRGKGGKWTQEERRAKDMTSIIQEFEDSPSEKQKLNSACETVENSDEDSGDGSVAYEALRPTYTHEALYKLLELGYLKHIITQNCDGLHGLSGVQDTQMSELHGNVFVETCEKCGERYDKDFYVLDDHCSLYYEEIAENGSTNIIKPKHAKQCDKCSLSHRTGRKCTKCKGFLHDTIINFKDHLNEKTLDTATSHAKQCDLMLSLGSTMTVSPANELAELGLKPLKLVICNRQKTELDNFCLLTGGREKAPLGSRLFGDCDRLMQDVMKYILPKDTLETWQNERQQRLIEYESQRKAV